MKKIILAIETSCDDTCASILINDNVVSNIIMNQEIHKQYNGVFPEKASRLHYDNIITAIQKALKQSKIILKNITHIAYTHFPGLIGSLLIGRVVAKTLSLILNIPLIKINHLYGHIASAEITNKIKYPALGIVISGGHTNLYYLKNNLKFKELGVTLDDAVGEALDKIGTYVGLKYPAGPKIDLLSKTGKLKYKFPVYHDKNYNFSFSGIKTSAKNFYNKKKTNINLNDFLMSYQYYLFNQIEYIVKKAIKDFKEIKSITITGGVSANSYIRKEWNKKFGKKVFFPEKQYSTDNAAMIGKYCYNLINTKNENSDT